MRIDTLRTLIAVLSLAAILLPRSTTETIRHLDSSSRDSRSDRVSDWESRRPTNRELQMLLRNKSIEKGGPVECCPSKMDMVMPVGGTRTDGLYVELFQVEKQKFYEISCLDHVVDKPCLFIDHRLQSQSRCVQKYSYSYALVRDDIPPPVEQHRHDRRSHVPHPHIQRNDSWRMDYIRVRSGCSCEITPKSKKKRAAKKGKRKRQGPDEDSLT
ncbi:uncharacterized protein [Anabrus simplex]|uniref:uncharacterized protein n=1 Tax=Anabrus simplex TaxID=316456 RepID=UPI0034DCEEE2